ncbi:MAG: DUF1045 domain-containing protein [Pseudomonadota bacterium]|nr:DUF1045 domain-containing protein [Pseudomonadota bacterium]
MTSSARYAIYYAPPVDDPLWALGSVWLGRDAYTGENLTRPDYPNFAIGDMDRLTSSPSHYGFHATMKAPFELKAGETEAKLLDRLEAFSKSQSAFDVGLAVKPLGQFLALQLTSNVEAMRALHEACVKDFDRFRAPLTQSDLERRRKANLSPEQDARLLEWGYPYIFDEFRWHMTLSNRIVSDSKRSKILSLLTEYFSPVIAKSHRIDGITLYRQIDRCAPFNIVARAVFPALVEQPT